MIFIGSVLLQFPCTTTNIADLRGRRFFEIIRITHWYCNISNILIFVLTLISILSIFKIYHKIWSVTFLSILWKSCVYFIIILFRSSRFQIRVMLRHRSILSPIFGPWRFQIIYIYIYRFLKPLNTFMSAFVVISVITIIKYIII